MARRCSYCSNNGHNSRTCPTRGGGGGGGNAGVGVGVVKLFGVRLTDGSIIKKSASMGNLSSTHYHSSSSATASPKPDSPLSDYVRDANHVPDGYLSDDPVAHASTNRRGERKKGVPWTEKEHRLFLIGLQKLGKGDWRGIAQNFVMSRTPTQVASHAQKYFIRQSNFNQRKRRSSLFDLVPDDMAADTPTVPEEQVSLTSSQLEEADNVNSITTSNLSVNSEFEHREAAAQETEQTMMESSGFTPMVHCFFPPYVPVPYQFWPPNPACPDEQKGIDASQHQVLKPIPLLPQQPANVDELVCMSGLSIEETENGQTVPSALSLKLLGEPLRQSAFRANAPVGGSDLSKGKTEAIQAV